MSRERLATAYDALADAYAQVAHELRGVEPPAAGVPDSVPTAPAAGAVGVPSAPAAPSSPLGVCPTHHVAWTIREGGISKNGKPYKAFWKCKERDDDDGYCDEKPDRAWAATHSAERALVDDSVPF